MKTSVVFIAGLFSSLTLLSGCSGSSDEPKPEAAEIKPREQITIDLSQQELVENSKKNYYAGLYTVSLDSLQALRDGYSPGPYTEFAEIKIGDVQFEMRDFALAAATFEEFNKNHPSSRSLPYTLLMAGRSFEMANKGVGRDAGPLEKARGYYERVIKEYPDSVYAGGARVYLQGIVEKLAAYEEMVSEFYKRHQNEEAANARNAHYAAHMKPLVEKTKLEAEQNTTQIQNIDLSADFSPELKGVQRVSEVSVRRPVPQAPEGAQSDNNGNGSEAGNLYRIQSGRCDSSAGSKAFIFLNREFEDERALEKFGDLAPNEGKIIINLPSTEAKPFSINCFETNDLSVSAEGVIELKTSRNATVLALSNPPRLLISLN